jgi:hypothetical protein
MVERSSDQSVPAPRAMIATATKHLRRIVPDEDFFAHCEQRKRRAIVAVFEVKKEIPD